MSRTHLRSTRMYVNAGMSFPSCCAGARLLDTDKASWPTIGDISRVTCVRCQRVNARIRAFSAQRARAMRTARQTEPADGPFTTR
jgi:hypothetical protein